MGKVIGKILATEKAPSTMEEFYFWTKSDLILNPFDIVKVKNVNDSITYGVVEEISHITDSTSFLSEFISNDFGETDLEYLTDRIGMNYVKAKIIGNSKNIFIPVVNASKVFTADKEEIEKALGLDSIKNPIPCGFIEMYQGRDSEDVVKITVNLDSNYLIGPEGAHLNISGISGLASKTSYAMFLIKSIQDKCLENYTDSTDNVAFVIFNVKGKDLLAIDQKNDFNRDEKEKSETYSLYEELGMNTKPFQNVHYYYPYSDSTAWNTFLDKDSVTKNICSNKADFYCYNFKLDKENIDLFFSKIDDSTGTMDSILNKIVQNGGEFGNCTCWQEFLKTVNDYGKAKNNFVDKEINVLSWRKFERIIRKSIYNNNIFDEKKTYNNAIRISDKMSEIKKNEIHVIDIAKLNDDLQCFVFGDTIRKLYNLQLEQEFSNDSDRPSKIIIFIDELNKYASKESSKNSPILNQILDITERGRSLGIVLFGAEQFRSGIHSRVTGNCSTFAYGRTNSIELAQKDYSFIPNIYKHIISRLRQGEYILQNPLFHSLLNIKFPKPLYKQFK